MQHWEVDLSSDTQTRPTAGMRAAIANAEVGDEQKREDPSVNRLQEMVAELTGKEAALFLPTGTMCNVIAISIHCRPGDEIILESTAHPIHFEGGGPAANAGASVHPLETETGVFTAEQVREAIRPDDPHFPRSRLVSIENTANIRGGRVWSVEDVDAVAACAGEFGLAMHLDGARLLNAAIATDVSVSEHCQAFDSCWIDLSKGLGCPAGAVLAGSRDFMDQAWRYKLLFGGAMRQAGILAAAGVYALEQHVERLAVDHERAKKLARGLAEIEGVRVDMDAVETNIVVFDVEATGLSREAFLDHLTPYSVRFSPLMGPTTLRAVTHLDIPDDGIERAISAVQAVVTEMKA